METVSLWVAEKTGDQAEVPRRGAVEAEHALALIPGEICRLALQIAFEHASTSMCRFLNRMIEQAKKETRAKSPNESYTMSGGELIAGQSIDERQQSAP